MKFIVDAQLPRALRANWLRQGMMLFTLLRL